MPHDQHRLCQPPAQVREKNHGYHRRGGGLWRNFRTSLRRRCHRGRQDESQGSHIRNNAHEVEVPEPHVRHRHILHAISRNVIIVSF